MTTPTPAAPTGDPAPAQAPAATQTPTTAPAPQAPAPAAPAPAPPAPVAEPQDVASLPAWAQQELATARGDAARYRQQLRDAQQTQQPAAPAAPQAPAAEVPDGDIARLPRWAQTQVTAGQDASRQLGIMQAVITAAPAAGVDITRVLDSQATMAALAQVDPTNAEAVTAALATALTTHPHLAIAQGGPARAGADFGQQQQTITAADFAAMGYRERAELNASNPDLYRQLANT